MNTAEAKLPKILLLGVAAASLSIGVSGAVSAGTTEPPGTEPMGTEAMGTEPMGTEPMGTDSMADHAMVTSPATGSLAVDGSADAASAEAEAFCAAELGVEAAIASEDPAAIGPAVEALTAAAEPAGATEVLDPVLANMEDQESPEFAEAYAGLIEWMKANCGYAELDISASEFAFEGVPAEMPAGGTIISLENVGEQVHEFIVMRVNDDVTLSLEELLALPEEESEAMVTPAAFAFAFPGTTASTTADLTAGRYVALCFLPDGATPDVLAQLEELGVDGPEDTIPADAGFELGPPHFTKGMVVEFTVV
jgi:hypothetical protein